MLSLSITRQERTEVGSCNMCTERTEYVYDIKLRYIGVRLCAQCMKILHAGIHLMELQYPLDLRLDTE